MIFPLHSQPHFQGPQGAKQLLPGDHVLATFDPVHGGRGLQKTETRYDHLGDTIVTRFEVNGIPFVFAEADLQGPDGVVDVGDLSDGDLVGYLFGYGHYGTVHADAVAAAIAGSEYYPGEEPLWLHGRGIGDKSVFLMNYTGALTTPFLRSIAAAYGTEVNKPIADPVLRFLPVENLTRSSETGIFVISSGDDFFLAEGLLVR